MTSLVTGGAGFVGTNLAARLLQAGERVVVLDDLSRPGVRTNLQWLEHTHPDRLEVVRGDVRSADDVRTAARKADRVFHFAAQVAVTTSVTEPVHDYSVNLGGTIALLEELRRRSDPPPLLFTSTNKVYGKLAGLRVEQRGGRYEPVDEQVREHGIGEHWPLQFASPYGCSKGGADQYVLDYAQTYGMPHVVFRMSCIYGPHQQGNEDQGWVAHFLLQARDRAPITLYGDGRQVRDVLYVDDLLDAMELAIGAADDLRGQAFNMGGGPQSTVSLLELLELIGTLGPAPEVRFGDWRVGDQRYYVSDTRRFAEATGWAPKTSPEEGVKLLHDWLASSGARVAASRAG
ncbi:MAG TPA: NAD-dependent epimerase/dehydratase family protein [Mycobacteriales bacterium]|nr:NAD-dependent epimerase/dehydratase family protein [Mycobacteriales bacterium]